MWQPQSCKISQYFECISMQLVLTQPLCILFPQSLKALISGNTSHYMTANSLILFVRLWWSAIQADVSGGLFWRNEDTYEARWISRFWDFSERMLHCIPKQTNLFNAVAIFTDTYANPLWHALLYVALFIHYTQPPQKTFLTLSFIDLLYPLLKSWKLHLMQIFAD